MSYMYVCAYIEIFNHQKGKSINICYNMDKPKNYYTKLKTDTEAIIPFIFNVHCRTNRDRNQVAVSRRGRLGMRMLWNYIMVVVIQHCKYSKYDEYPWIVHLKRANFMALQPKKKRKPLP